MIYLLKEYIYRFIKRGYISIVLSLAFIILAIWGIGNTYQTTTEKQMESLQNSINRSVTQCYAIEGTYPPSLEYIKEHYGLSYDEDKFFVDYQTLGSNMMPDITIITINQP